MENNNYDIFFFLGVIANLLQIENYDLNVTDVKNSELLKELNRQDQMLNEQTNIYLKRILENQEEIIRLLKEK